MTNSQRDLNLYCQTAIDLALQKGSHMIDPNRNYSLVLATLIEMGMKQGVHVSTGKDNVIYLAKKRDAQIVSSPTPPPTVPSPPFPLPNV